MLSYSDTNSNKPTLLFLHGLSLNKKFWESTIEHLSNDYRCIALDLPGHGESRSSVTNGSMSAYAAAVREVIEKLNLQNVTMVGHSMGGQISIILALQMPSVISKLVLVCAAGIETFTPDEATKLKTATRAIYSNPLSEDVLHRTFAHTREEIKHLLMHEHVVQQKENFQQLSSLIISSVEGMLNEPVFHFLNTITQPTLCLYGVLDTAIPNRWLHPHSNVGQLLQNAKQVIPTCTTSLFPLSGHYLPVDQPAELGKAIGSFDK